jgi:GNAT superfamily N-acetyltransferase
MASISLALEFEEMTEADVPALTRVMTRAFDDDSQKHLGEERGGPPGYDDGEFLRKWVFGYQETVGYKVIAEGRVIGGLILWIFEHGENVLGTIFVDPAHQDRGVGAGIWAFVEATYPETISWQLRTPAFAVKNHHFYEKLGFVKIAEEPFQGPGGTSYIYRKECGRPG